ncbi:MULTISPECIES: hypothetical protein [unclassified Bradyrhizobium]|uniref:hypothetical protein n=1 Tax=unclassified Bradyrhizobium TaxID=2631580 RepID=UPI001FFB1E8D|nr:MULTISPECIES: hypothetical protein [unclassified Bradyrhizobium]MCK1708296.1 hypothetical protein [Bradyrhizobium sp. 143]MCK1732051.1 hypothetical protein [Bradyrhizobium sp. 142]
MPQWLVAIGGIMQRFFYQLNESNRRIVRKWRLATLGFYGSILAGMLLYVALHLNPEVNYVSADSPAHAKVVNSQKH